MPDLCRGEIKGLEKKDFPSSVWTLDKYKASGITRKIFVQFLDNFLVTTVSAALTWLDCLIGESSWGENYPAMVVEGAEVRQKLQLSTLLPLCLATTSNTSNVLPSTPFDLPPHQNGRVVLKNII